MGHEYGNNTQGGDAWDPVKKKPVENKAINLKLMVKVDTQTLSNTRTRLNQYIKKILDNRELCN